jgi:hypothetical protein
MTTSAFATVLIRFLALTLMLLGLLDFLSACIGVIGEMDLQYLLPFFKTAIAPSVLRMVAGVVLWKLTARFSAALSA